MRTDKYYSAGREVAERAGLTKYRYHIEGDRFILSETDIRNMVTGGMINPSEFASLDIKEVSRLEADYLIIKAGRSLGDKEIKSDINKEEQNDEDNQ